MSANNNFSSPPRNRDAAVRSSSPLLYPNLSSDLPSSPAHRHGSESQSNSAIGGLVGSRSMQSNLNTPLRRGAGVIRGGNPVAALSLYAGGKYIEVIYFIYSAIYVVVPVR